MATEIVLPEIDHSSCCGSYGDIKMAAQYCGLSHTPHSIGGEWQHGWICPERNIHPEFVIGSDGRSREVKAVHTFFVARQDQVEYLRSQGYRHVHAIGLPIIYVPKPAVSRIVGSLLVMPAHSLPETTENWDADEYLQYISSIAHRFSEICLCVHKSCHEKGNWVGAFERHGITVIVGADEQDQNSLLRMATLFNRFDYMTTNEFGSQVAYASYFGCKVSVAGPRVSWKRSDKENLTYYKNAPELLDIYESWRDNQVLEKAYPQFVCDPWDASLNVEWASAQLGVPCKQSVQQLKRLFGWLLGGLVKKRMLKYLRVISQKMKIIPRRLYLKFKWKFREEMSIPTHLTTEEKFTLYQCSSRLQSGAVCVEIGSYLGASACFIAAGVDDSSRLYCVDTWQNDAMAYTEEEKNDERLKPQDTYEIFRKNTVKYRSKIYELRGKSCDVSRALIDERIIINLLFIDGDHEYDGVLADWRAYKNLLVSGSIVAFHDTGWAEGVNKVISEHVAPIGCLIKKLSNLEIYRIDLK